MFSQDIELIDHLINSFKVREKEKGFLNIDIRFIFLLEIIRFELMTTSKISDDTAGAINTLFVFQAHEFFYRDFPELDSECSTVHNMLIKYNDKYKNHENLPMPGVDDDKWINYFHMAFSSLIKSNKPSITELDSATKPR